MQVPNQSIVALEHLTCLPGEWLREWAAGQQNRVCTPAPRVGVARTASRRISVFIDKVRVETLPSLAKREPETTTEWSNA